MRKVWRREEVTIYYAVMFIAGQCVAPIRIPFANREAAAACAATLIYAENCDSVRIYKMAEETNGRWVDAADSDDGPCEVIQEKVTS